MKTRIGTFLLLTIAFSASRAWSQSDSSGQSSSAPTGTDPRVPYVMQDTPQDTTAGTPGPKVAYTYPDSASPMSFLSEAAENSSITLGIGAGLTYTSNLGASTVAGNTSGLLYQVRPSIKLQEFRPKLSMMIRYAGGVQDRAYFGNASSYNNQRVIFSHNAGADILWQLTQRWQMHVYDQYVHSADPFDSYVTTSGIPTQSNPNPVTYAPLAVYSQNMGLLSLTNQLTRHDTLTFTGTEDFRRTSNSGSFSNPFQNMISYGGRGDYAHQVSARLTLGAGYEFDSYDFGHGIQRSGVQTIKLSTSYLITRNTNFSVWVGPEYSSIKNIVHIFFFTETLHDSQWNISGGASFGWRGIHNAVRASFNHQVSAGSFLLGTSNVYETRADYSRVLSPRWNFNSGFEYFNNVSVSLTKRTLEEIIFDAYLRREFRRSLSADLRYAYIHQNQQHIYAGRPSFSNSQIGFNIQYNWNHPLGR